MPTQSNQLVFFSVASDRAAGADGAARGDAWPSFRTPAKPEGHPTGTRTGASARGGGDVMEPTLHRRAPANADSAAVVRCVRCGGRLRRRGQEQDNDTES